MKNLWLDANTIIRYLTNDLPDQAARIQKLIRRAEAGEVKLFVDRLIAAEVFWALGSSTYKFPISKLAEILVPFFSSEHLEVEDRSLLVQAIELSRDKNVGFTDAYLAARVLDRQEEVVTFDKSDFKKLPAKWSSPE